MLRGVCSNARKVDIPGAKISQFTCVKEKMVWDNVVPKTIPFSVFQQIENIDRDYFTAEEQFYLDLYLFSFFMPVAWGIKMYVISHGNAF